MDALAARTASSSPTSSSLTAWTLGLLAIMALLALPQASANAAPQPARSADSFVDSIGVNTHTYYSDTVYYSRFEDVKKRLAELGVRHIRENLVPERLDQYQRLNQLAAMGIRSTLILGDPTNGISGLETLLSVVKKDLNGTVAALESTNEFDISGHGDWLPRLSAYHEHLYRAIKSDPSLASLPVVGPSIVHWDSQDDLGDISDQLDYGNIHSYPDGYFPESNLSSHLSHAVVNSASKPVMATETGYHTALNWTRDHKPASEQAMATYMPRMFLEYFRRGVVRTFSYELLDEHPDPKLDDRESNFGLLRNDLSEKPAFVALRNMIDILDDPGSSFVPGALDYSLSGNQTDLHQVLLQKRDGSFYLALWRTGSVWDPVNRVALNPSPAPVTLSFDLPLESAERYAPNASAAPVASLANPGEPLTVEIGPQVTILKVTTGDGDPPPPPPEPEPSPEPEPAPDPSPEPSPESEPSESSDPASGGGSPATAPGQAKPRKRKRPRVKVWVDRRSVRVGQRLALRGRVTVASGGSARVAIQRWAKGWRTVSRSRTSKSGFFGKRIRVRLRPGVRFARLRVVAPAVAPSRQIRVRVKR